VATGRGFESKELALNLRKLVVLAALLPLATACQSLKRAGKDLAVIGTCPLTIPLNGVRDSLDWGPDTSTATPIVLLPLNLPLHMIKHFGYTIVHVVDVIVAPIYLLASIPKGYDLEPIDLYSLTDGYPWRSAPWPAFEE
jgi:hypothetical protein